MPHLLNGIAPGNNATSGEMRRFAGNWVWSKLKQTCFHLFGGSELRAKALRSRRFVEGRFYARTKKVSTCVTPQVIGNLSAGCLILGCHILVDTIDWK